MLDADLRWKIVSQICVLTNGAGGYKNYKDIRI